MGSADHARQVREHIQKLGQKAYWRQLPATPDFVVMFLHDESSWVAALDVDPSLHELALSNNVIPASLDEPRDRGAAADDPLRVAAGESRGRRAQASELGRELHKRLSTMGAHIARLGRGLDTAVKSYNQAVGSLGSRVMVAARRLQDRRRTADGEPARAARA